MTLLDVEHKDLFGQLDPSEKNLNEKQTLQYVQGHYQLDLFELLEEERPSNLIPADLRFVLLMEHVHSIHLYLLKHIDTCLMAQSLDYFLYAYLISFMIDSAHFSYFVAVEGVTLYLAQDICEIFLANISLSKTVPDAMRCIFLAKHDVELDDVMEHVFHVSFEDIVELFVKDLRVVLGLRDALCFGELFVGLVDLDCKHLKDCLSLHEGHI